METVNDLPLTKSNQAGPLPSSDISENVHLEEPLSPRNTKKENTNPERTDSVTTPATNSVSSALFTAVKDAGAVIKDTASMVGKKVQTLGPYASPASVAPSDVDPLAMAKMGAEKEKEDAQLAASKARRDGEGG